MLKNCLLAAAFIILNLISAQGAEPLVWDFSKPESFTGNTAIKLRGKSQLINGVLQINPDMTCGKGSGAITVKRFSEITPKGAFEIVFDFTLDEALTAGAKHKLVLADCKYVIYPKANQAKYHKGFQVFLTRAPQAGKYYIWVSLGFGKLSRTVRSQEVSLATGKLQTAAVKFTTSGKVRFFANGKAALERSVPAEPIAASDLYLVIGDRIDSTFSPFTGSISKVVLQEIPDEKAAEVKKK